MSALSWRLLVPGWSLWTLPRRVAITLLIWRERSRQRAMLAELDGHLLRDLGISAAEAQREWEKPFWRP
jgi:uncharacterized protein YjiS (DUF1127 family)